MTSNGTATGTACHNCGERAGWRDDDQGVPRCMECVITHGGGRRHSILPTEIAPGVVEAFEPGWVSLGQGLVASIAGEPSYAPTAAEGFPARPIPPIGPETGTEGPQRATGVATAMGVAAGVSVAGSILDLVAYGKHPDREPDPSTAVDLEHDQADDPQAVWDEIDQAWTDAPDAFACGDAFGCAVETGREQAKRLAEALATIARLTQKAR